MTRKRIYFYKARLNYFDTSSGSTRKKSSDPVEVMKVIEALEWDRAKPSSVYMGDGNSGDVVAIKVLKNDRSTKAVSGQVAKIRYSDLPQVEQFGDLSNLELPVGAGLFEASHFTYFYDAEPHTLALEFNVSAPRHKTMSKYLVEKLFNHPTVPLDEASFTPIIRGDVLDQVLRMGNIGEMTLSVRRDGISEIEAADNRLGTALRAQADYAPEMAIVGINLARKKYARTGGGGQELKERVFSTIRKLMPLFQTASVKVEDDDGILVEKNLLSDKLVHTVILKDGKIDSEEMINRMGDAYVANRTLLRNTDDLPT